MYFSKHLMLQEVKKIELAKTSSQKNGVLKKSKQISIIIPTYQEEKILSKLKNIYTNEIKTEFNCEIIVSDGGSTDNTINIAQEFADKIIEHNSPKRQTIAEGRNKGAELAEGNVLVFINADTYPANLRMFMKSIQEWSLEQMNNYGAIACYVSGFPDEINTKDKIFYFLHNGFVRILNTIKLGMGRGECQIIRKDLFYLVNGYNPNIVAGEDFDLFRRVSKHTKILMNTNFLVYESPRRFRKYGYLKTIWFWLINALSIIFAGKSYSKEWEAIR